MVIGDNQYVYYTQLVWIHTEGHQYSPQWNICCFEFGLSHAWRKTKGIVYPFVSRWEDHIFLEYDWFDPIIIYQDEKTDKRIK